MDQPVGKKKEIQLMLPVVINDNEGIDQIKSMLIYRVGPSIFSCKRLLLSVFK